MNTQPDEPTALPAALGLGFLAAGGWLLATARPWQKPGSPLILGLGWGASGVLLLCGLVLLTRCVRTLHGPPASDATPRSAPVGEVGRDPDDMS